jgi:hypothetical protein
LRAIADRSDHVGRQPIGLYQIIGAPRPGVSLGVVGDSLTGAAAHRDALTTLAAIGARTADALEHGDISRLAPPDLARLSARQPRLDTGGASISASATAGKAGGGVVNFHTGRDRARVKMSEELIK